MNNPTFKLEGVVKSRESMEDFEGPLQLILQLLSKNKIEIKDIKVSAILDQYLAYLSEMKSMDLDVASEFITMASHLTYIKAKSLLDEEGEASELEALISSLEELKSRERFGQLKESIEFLALQADNGMLYYVKPPETLPKNGEYRYSHHAGELKKALALIAGRSLENSNPAPNIIIPARLIYPVGEKSEEIILLLRSEGILPVSRLFESCGGRSELVATFMALLQLCRSGAISLEEDNGEYIAGFLSMEA